MDFWNMESCCKIMLKEKLGMLFFILVGMSYPVLAEVLVSTTEHLLYARHFGAMSPSLWRWISRLSTQMSTRTLCAALSQWPLSVLAPPQGQEHSMPGAWTFPPEEPHSLGWRSQQRGATHSTPTAVLEAIRPESFIRELQVLRGRPTPSCS